MLLAVSHNKVFTFPEFPMNDSTQNYANEDSVDFFADHLLPKRVGRLDFD